MRTLSSTLGTQSRVRSLAVSVSMLQPPGLHSLVALVLEVLAVAVVQQQSVGVVLVDPLHLLDVKRALGLHPLALPASGDGDGQTCAEDGSVRLRADRDRLTVSVLAAAAPTRVVQ